MVYTGGGGGGGGGHQGVTDEPRPLNISGVGRYFSMGGL